MLAVAARGMRTRRIGPLLGALVLLVPTLALARAGGGGDYSPGSDDDGGGGDASAIVWLLLRVILWAFSVSPLFGLMVTGAVIGGAVLLVRSRASAVTARKVRSLDVSRFAAASAGALDPIRARDSAFDRDAFLRRASAAFVRVQEAWSRGDLRPVRPFLSDAVWARFALLLALNRRRGRRNVVGDVRVREATLVAVVAGADFDELHVRIAAEARDADVAADAEADAAGRALRARPLEPFVEVWSFLRRAGAATLARPGALEGACPQCAAPLAGGEVARCGHCGVLVSSGVHDWVLAEITQEVGFGGASAGDVPGLAELKARDPNLSRQAIEDRASLVFWRWLEALVTGEATGLRKLASRELHERLAATLETSGSAAMRAARGPVDLDRLAVGSADLVLAEAGKEHERAHVRIHWSAVEGGARAPSPRAHFLVLARRAGARSRSQGLEAASCPRCGGPLDATDSPTCAYCGADLASGDADFVLEAVLHAAEWAQLHGARPAPAAAATVAGAAAAAGAPPVAGEDDTRVNEWLLPDPRVPLERERLVHAMVLAAASDGRYARGEARLLRAAAKRFAVAPDKVAAWMDAALRAGGNGDGAEGAAGSGGGLAGGLLVRSLASVALVDGRIDRRERELLERLGGRSGLGPQQVARIVAAESQRVAARRPAA